MASLDDPGEVREGFLCPLCLKDLQSFYQLHSHYEEEHSGEDRDVKGQIKSLVQKAKKAKDKLLKREGDDRAESGTQGYESFSYGGVDPYMWEPQELGAVRSHLSEFKKHRAARIDHYVVEVNKLIIRLEKLTAFDRTNTESAKIRAIEKSVVPWVNDQDVPFCPDCGNKFSIRNRRHHCRLCGSIMCKKCMELISLPLANKLTSASKESLSTHTSPSQSPNSVHGSRRGSISSMSSVSSVLDEKDDDRIRCCTHCKDTLLKREQQIDEKEHTPDIVKLYEKLRLCMEKVDQKAPEYIKMAASLNAGETTYSLEHASDLRVEVQKVYELIDALSKKILTLGLNQDPPPHPSNLRLQRMIRYSATLFVQEKLLGLMSLPTKEQFEELKKKRKEEMERKRAMERQAALESQRRLEERHSGLASQAANGEVASLRRGPAPLRKAEGWLPLSGGQGQSEDSDPLLQQIHNITSFIKQAKAAGRKDEVRTLQENLRQLQDEYDQQQTEKAIELSRRQAEEEDLQREQLQMLRERELEREREQFRVASLHTRTRSLDFREIGPFQLEPSREPRTHLAYALDLGSSSIQSSIAPKTPTPSSAQEPIRVWSGPSALGQELLTQSSMSQQNEGPSLNPFDEEDLSSPMEEGTASPPAAGASFGPSAHISKEYNPFEEEDDKEEAMAGNPFIHPDSPAPNPFNEEAEHPQQRHSSPLVPGNPFEEPTCTNPFEMDSDSGPEAEEPIEEELLLQQIDNIKAYIFDAKQCGRLDEVEVLTENLRELKHTLAKQKGGTD
ncbi:rabenosyn-5 isoform X1 [Callithrix jacchus]|uniref:Rabenosyn, RAB effector n=2 Tax=Callithrix jacchus TaxID=9483 RepID=U3F3V6_CALJA|nr:rabenosyn-5 isoform X1 [Callithrix jacchus]XP_008980447.2 rabenosyn-5 isoform X1 [Callithrix jacchus]XP_008980448.2 rabenosyn-5 isoform X1 [Callithrix jacchus]XP_035129671.1 rabenosyn-5 isoform X1 [Callithrix jacchus]XP_035129672.1 rabenosyn-5 isoform X1 [Callithrix jacchus]